MNRLLPQRETIFHVLYQKFKEGNGEYVPVHQLMGEHFVKELDRWGYVSYECSARASEMKRDNPELIHREMVVGRSGAKYYAYRINPRPKPEMIKDPKLREFYGRIASKRVLPAPRKDPYAEHNAAMQEVWDGLPPHPPKP